MKDRNKGTIRNHPNIRKQTNEFTVRIFESQDDYAKYHNNWNEFKRYTDKLSNYSVTSLSYNSLELFVSDYLKCPLGPKNRYDDLTFQEVADSTGRKVIVNTRLWFYHHKFTGYTDNFAPGYSGGPTQGYTYTTPEYKIKADFETRNKRNRLIEVYIPETLISGEVIEISDIQLDSDNYQLTTQLRKHYPDPCKCCWYHNGRIWMLKGTGRKSKSKTKGMRKFSHNLDI